MIRAYFRTHQRFQLTLSQLLSENPHCKHEKTNAVVTNGAAGYWLFNLWIENFDQKNLSSLCFDLLSFLAFGGNPSSFLLFASPIVKTSIIEDVLHDCDFY